MPSSNSLTHTSLIAASSEFLTTGNYQPVPEAVCQQFGLEQARVFEDAFGVVAIVVYETWEELHSSWPDHQGALVDLLSAYVPSVEAKAWEGYLVLLTLGGIGEDAEIGANEIRYNMTRVRKLVGIGAELRSLADLERILRPLLPLEPRELIPEPESALSLLPELLASGDLPADMIRTAIAAFMESQPIVAAMHAAEAAE